MLEPFTLDLEYSRTHFISKRYLSTYYDTLIKLYIEHVLPEFASPYYLIHIFTESPLTYAYRGKVYVGSVDDVIKYVSANFILLIL